MTHGRIARCIDYCILPTRLGALLVAGTERGVRLVHLADGPEALCARLRAEFPSAALRRRSTGVVRHWCEEVARAIDARSPSLHVPLDVRGSRFRRRVWTALRRIPRGETRSYSEVAASLGQPTAARAVAGACAANPVPVLVPCHRVVAKGGGLGGYALGATRKRALLDGEGARPESGPTARGRARVADPPERRYTAPSLGSRTRLRSVGCADRVPRPLP